MPGDNSNNKESKKIKKIQEQNKAKIYTFTPKAKILLEELFAHYDFEETAVSVLEEAKANIEKKDGLIRFILKQTKEFLQEENLDFPMSISGDFLICIQHWTPEQFFRTRFVICEYEDACLRSEVFGTVKKEENELKVEFEYYIEDEDYYAQYKNGERITMPITVQRQMDEALIKLTEEESEEAEALISYMETKQDDHVLTLSEWKRMLFPYRVLLAIGEERNDLVRYVWLGDELYLVPKDPKHTGVAIGCTRGKMCIYQLLIIDGLIPENSKPFSVYDIEDIQEAIAYTDDLFDKSTYCGMTFTIPVDPDFTVRSGEEIIYDTERLREGLLNSADITGEQKEKVIKMLSAVSEWKEKYM